MLSVQHRAAQEPRSPEKFTSGHDRLYTRLARPYDWLVRTFPPWKRWLDQALPWIEGPRILEASFGTGYLLTRCAGQVCAYGFDLNRRLARMAYSKLTRLGLPARLLVANVEALPYSGQIFDSIVCTLAFSGYPRGEAALRELARVLRPGGRMILVDVNVPADGNRVGMVMAAFWRALGDILRDMNALLQAHGFQVEDYEIGGFGSVHLYLALKPQPEPETATEAAGVSGDSM